MKLRRTAVRGYARSPRSVGWLSLLGAPLVALTGACTDESPPPVTSLDAASRLDASGASDSALARDLGHDAFALDASALDAFDLPDVLDLADATPFDGGAMMADAGLATPACPPMGPFGSAVGDIAPDVELLDCDGNPHHLHELCARRTAWIFEYTGW